MGKYTDEDIRSLKKVTCQIAADYLGVPVMALRIGMQQNRLPIGFANHHKDRYTDHWSYHIIAERLIAYKHGTVNELQIEGIEKSLERIIQEFTEMKKDLMSLLRERPQGKR